MVKTLSIVLLLYLSIHHLNRKKIQKYYESPVEIKEKLNYTWQTIYFLHMEFYQIVSIVVSKLILWVKSKNLQLFKKFNRVWWNRKYLFLNVLTLVCNVYQLGIGLSRENPELRNSSILISTSPNNMLLFENS